MQWGADIASRKTEGSEPFPCAQLVLLCRLSRGTFLPSFLYFRSLRSSYHRHLDYVGAAEEANVVHEQAACLLLHLLSVLKRT